MSKKTIATHNAKFHTDDVFAVATLFLLYGKENCEVVRTRDRETIQKADIVVDVGEVYDPETNRFDHHQKGGAGERGNGVPYAAFGLVWKHFGEQVSGSKEVAESIERSLVQFADAGDNGKDIFSMLVPDVYPLTVIGLVDLYRSTWKEKGNWDERFDECVEWAQSVLSRMIKVEQDSVEGRKIATDAYHASEDKRVIVVGEEYSLGREVVAGVLQGFPEPLYAVLYREDAGGWQVAGVRKESGAFDLRKPLPEAWGAKSGEELAQASGVPDAEFCHRSLFMCTAKSKEGALALAHKALNA